MAIDCTTAWFETPRQATRLLTMTVQIKQI